MLTRSKLIRRSRLVGAVALASCCALVADGLSGSVTPQEGGGISASFDGGISGGGGTPSWVLSGATVDMDFVNGRYFGDTLANLLSITRASNATDLLPSSASGYAYNTFSSNVLAISPTFGLLVFEARTNQLLNSTAPVTQTTGALAATAQTLWVNGSGSAAMSNGTATGCTGTATNGTPDTFTPTAGTCVVTVTGSLNAFQLEAGAFGTSFIVTAGATATRAADNIGITGAAKTLLQAPPSAAVVVTNAAQASVAGQGRVLSFNGNVATLLINSNTIVGSFNGGATVTATLGSGSYSAGRVKSGNAWTTGAQALVANNGVVTDSANGFPAGQPSFFLGSQGGSANFASGIYERMTLWSSNLPDATLKALTQ